MRNLIGHTARALLLMAVLVACRAAVYGALVPAPTAHACRKRAEFVADLCTYPGPPTRSPTPAAISWRPTPPACPGGRARATATRSRSSRGGPSGRSTSSTTACRRTRRCGARCAASSSRRGAGPALHHPGRDRAGRRGAGLHPPDRRYPEHGLRHDRQGRAGEAGRPGRNIAGSPAPPVQAAGNGRPETVRPPRFCMQSAHRSPRNPAIRLLPAGRSRA